MFLRKVFLCSFLLVCLIVSSQALECYNCTSLNEPKCTINHFKSKGINKVNCLKGSCYIAHYFHDSKPVTDRGCSLGSPEPFGGATDACTKVKRMYSANAVRHCEECKTNLCNSAPAQFAGYAVPLVLLALGVFKF